MVLKVTFAQPIFDSSKHTPQTSKDGFKKKKATSFASVLENTIQSKSIGK